VTAVLWRAAFEVAAEFTVVVFLNKPGALSLAADAIWCDKDDGRLVQIVTLAARHAVPVIYPSREDAVAGGLMRYGPSVTDQFRQAGVYTVRISKEKTGRPAGDAGDQGSSWSSTCRRPGRSASRSHPRSWPGPTR